MRDIRVGILVVDRYLKCFDVNSRKKLMEWGWSGDGISEECSGKEAVDIIEECNVIITSWRSPVLTEDIVSSCNNIELVCHAAGTVKQIVSEAVWERDIKVINAGRAIAVGVAEHAFGLMLSVMKNSYAFNDCMKNNRDTAAERERVVETYGTTVGVVGFGNTGRHFVKLLGVLDMDILVCDPYLSEEKAIECGVTKVSLEELLTRSNVISLHAPKLEKTNGMINTGNLKLVRDDAIIINTASGWLIDEDALIAELERRPSIRAALDVTSPEPAEADSELRKMDNVILTPHVAGVCSNNFGRIGKLVTDEIERFGRGEALQHLVSKDRFSERA
jgi:phosphoglycerate dehydrogenase-like enzyme